MVASGTMDGGTGPPGYIESTYPTGVYGWRKRCLYFCLALLTATVVVNLALTVWIIRVMDFSFSGMGTLRILDDGIQVQGKSEFLHPVEVSHIETKQGSALHMESPMSVSLCSTADTDTCQSQLTLDEDTVEVNAKKLTVKQKTGELIMSATRDKLEFGSDSLTVTGNTKFIKGIHTPFIRSASQIRIESPSERIHIIGSSHINMTSAGEMVIHGKESLKFKTVGKLRFDARNIMFSDLKLPRTRRVAAAGGKFFQLCVCSDTGKLFLAGARANCTASSDICK